MHHIIKEYKITSQSGDLNFVLPKGFKLTKEAFMSKQLSNQDIKDLIEAFGNITGMKAYFNIEALDYKKELIDISHVKENLDAIHEKLNRVLSKINFNH